MLTYKIPEKRAFTSGDLVSVPLKKKTVTGIIFNIHNNKPSFETLEIKEKLATNPPLTNQQIDLIKWLNQYYFCPLNKIIKLFIPKRVFDNKKLPKSYKKSQTKTPKTTNRNEQIISSTSKTLTNQQQAAIKEITENSLNKFLIHGITGSGKTEIYTRLAETYIKQGKQALILVPEISLTPQIIKYFEEALQIKAAVIHSRLSEGEKQESWLNIKENKAKLIIGSRSAVFSPFQNLGIIIMDEEHELSYKQDNSPRYSAYKMIEKIQELNPEIKIVYGSATPSIETAEKLKDSTILLTERINKIDLPKVEIVDLREEFKKKNYSIFSDSLKEEMLSALSKNEQIILFLNRRGSASSVVCRDCGYIEKCKTCDVPTTYHEKTFNQNKLICHHCGQISKPPIICPVCKGTHIKYLGIGTQKIETEVKKEFPNARILRADKDTTAKKHGFEEIYKKFLNHEADILIGTQMITKGLHLPKVNLVGVILADIGINIPDFKTAERTFQLLTQVAGRAGRDKSQGKVIIQTYNPENISLVCAKTHNYAEFFKYERTQRKLLFNPPFSRLAKIMIQNEHLKKCQENTEKIYKLLNELLKETSKSITKDPKTPTIEIMSYPAYLARLKGKYRYIILIKDKSSLPDLSAQPKIHNLLEKLPKEYIMDTNIKIDIDPITTT
jgi:primosomal protein N' (replication factor Y)